MKIVNLETFRALPPNTLFSKVDPWLFGHLEIKGETLRIDFFTTSDLASSIDCADSNDGCFGLLESALKDGSSVKMDFETQQRDGMFLESQLFSVWEDDDVLSLIERLKQCVH